MLLVFGWVGLIRSAQAFIWDLLCASGSKILVTYKLCDTFLRLDKKLEAR